MKELRDLKKGDKIKILYGARIHKSKVLGNDPEKQIILLKIYIGWFFGWIIIEQVFHYKDYNLENYKLLN